MRTARQRQGALRALVATVAIGLCMAVMPTLPEARAIAQQWGDGLTGDIERILDDRATAIVEGEVLHVDYVSQDGEVSTIATFEIASSTRGDLSGQILVEMLGGIADDGSGTIVSHQPFLVEGQRLQLHLVETPASVSAIADSSFSIVAGTDGVRSLTGDLVQSQSDAIGDYAFTGSKIPATSFPMTYLIKNDTPAWAQTEIQESFADWEISNACINIDWNYGGLTTTSPAAGIDNRNVVGRVATPNPADAYLARATWYFTPAGDTLQFDISINADDHAFVDVGAGATGGFDLRTVMGHEVGHVLGLDHPPAPSELMFDAIPPDAFKLIGPGDASGLFSLYSPCSPAPPPPVASGFVPVTPCAILDSRFGTNFQDPFSGQNTRVEGQSSISAQVTGAIGPAYSNAACAQSTVVPANATAVMVNVIAVSPIASGNLRIAPSGQTAQGGVVNFAPGNIGPGSNSNAVPVAIGPDGAVNVFVNAAATTPTGSRAAATHVRLVVLGYYVDRASNPSALGFVPVTPCAMFDTRATGTVATGGQTLTAQMTGSVSQSGAPCASSGPIPSNASGVMVNVVAVNPIRSGNLRISAAGTSAQGGVVNFGTGAAASGTNSNAVPVGLSSSGAVDVVVNAPSGLSTTHVRLVALGYYVPANSTPATTDFTAITPCAGFDSRPTNDMPEGQSVLRIPLAGAAAQPGRTCPAGVVPAGAKGVLVNVVAVNPQRNGNLRISAAGTSAQGGVVNFGPGSTGPGTNANAVPVALSSAGEVDVDINATAGVDATHVRLVILGYYT